MSTKQHLKVCASLVMAIAVLAGCDRGEKLISTKLEQAKMVQEHVSSFAAACQGTLSMSSEFTGDIEKPVITRVSCDKMDKTSQLFTPMNAEEEKELEKKMRLINRVPE